MVDVRSLEPGSSLSVETIASLHTSVMLQECLAFLHLSAGRVYVDGTLGLGGHSLAISEVLSTLGGGILIGVDQDPTALALATQRIQEKTRADSAATPARFLPIASNYSTLALQWQQLRSTEPSLPERVNGGLLLDLGVSSMQLDQAERGFSFMRSGPLDMRMNPQDNTLATAAEILNTWDETALADCFFLYGEEQFSRSIARAIVNDRQQAPWKETLPLAQLIERVYRSQQRKRGKKQEGKHPATRVFQALRIAVNGELNHLQALLTSLPSLMASGSRVVILTFHSLEDRLVKQQFKQWATRFTPNPYYPDEPPAQEPIVKLISKKAVLPTPEEIERNPRSRSVKLRVVEFL
ncbi:MAG: 16S rRNA (cytosine(1402)-N(4))-methyltransferase RsmH [Vampirovibrionales bacterium]